MKKQIANGIIILSLARLSPSFAEAQGTVAYVSNLGRSQAGSLAVGSDSWVGNEFTVGTNTGGYALNSVQLAMADAVGNPNGFTVTLYANWAGPTSGHGTGDVSFILSLLGSTNPSTAGIYTYTPQTALYLSQNYIYSVVLTAGTPVANGSYNWSEGDGALGLSDGWNSVYYLFYSSDGLTWSSNPTSYGNYPEFAVSAVAAPEPGVSAFWGIGILLFCPWRKLPDRTDKNRA
jgi:hypothetical protein